MTKLKNGVILLVLVTLWGCSDSGNNTIILDSAGKHSSGWIVTSSGGLHPAAYKANQSACVECHGSAQNPLSTGGTSGISCFSAAYNGIGCHPSGPSGHPAGWSAPASHGGAAKATPDASHGFASCTNCHGANYTGAAGTSCKACHTTAPHPAAPWRGTTATKTTHSTTDPANAAQCSRCHAGGVKLATPVAPLAGAGCFNNTLCHASAGHPAGWAATGHQIAAKAAAGTSAGMDSCRSCHGTDFKGGTAGVSCMKCHTSSPHSKPWLGSTGATTHKHSAADTTNAPSCGSCHAGGAKSLTPTTPPANAGCFNSTLCHAAPPSGHAFPNPGSAHLSAANGTGCLTCHAQGSASSNYPVTAGTAPNCRGCHLNANPGASPQCSDCHGSVANNSAGALLAGRPVGGAAFPNRPGQHNRSEHVGRACTVCHPFTSGDSRHGWSNGVKSTAAQVGGTGITSWNAATKSCTPVCHSSEKW